MRVPTISMSSLTDMSTVGTGTVVQVARTVARDVPPLLVASMLNSRVPGDVVSPQSLVPLWSVDMSAPGPPKLFML